MPSSPSTPPPDRLAFLKGRDFAHRGRHGQGVIENSRTAFRAAIAAGEGIECDVRASSDGVIFVFHDAGLERLTNARGAVADLAAAEIGSIRLKDGDGTIPTLAEVLALVAGAAPLLIEIKAPPRGPIAPLCEGVEGDLAGYAGPVAVMSFHPGIIRWFRAHAPERVRGLVVTETGHRGIVARLRRHLAFCHARPDFLAYDIRDLPSPFAERHRARGLPVLSWTVRGDEELGRARAHADGIIHERG